MKTRRVLLATTLSAMLSATAGLAPSATAAPQAPGDSATKTYIVKTRSLSAAAGVASEVSAAGGQVKNRYKRIYPGFSATLTAAQVEALKANPRVEAVIADQVVRSTSTQTDPTWGLDRIDQRPVAGDGTYSYDTDGTGVTAYILDTGIRNSHGQFGGRAVSGFDFVDNDADASDCNGHGTHVAGSVGGSTYGVAKGVTLVGVRVLDCGGSGTAEGVIAGIDWVAANHSGPSVLNMSLAGLAYAPLDDAVEAASAAGVSVVVAASNDDDNACNYSPARTPSAITVAATDVTDTRAWFSNWGTCVDVFAPGVDVKSAWWTADDATDTLSGTSMASPHVAGVVARYLQSHPSATPASATAALLADATPGVVVDPNGSPNLLSYVATSALPGKTLIKKAAAGSRSDRVVSVTGRWAAPATGGAVTKYYVTAIRKSDGATKTVTASSTARSKKITGLRRSATYVIRVYAKNAAGTGPLSKASNTVKAR